VGKLTVDRTKKLSEVPDKKICDFITLDTYAHQKPDNSTFLPLKFASFLFLNRSSCWSPFLLLARYVPNVVKRST